MSQQLWMEMVQSSTPVRISAQYAERLYHEAANAYLFDNKLTINPGPFETDITKLFEQYRMLRVLKGNNNEMA
jgi:hypothetical protein